MGSISFNDIPNNIRVPFMGVEFDSTNATSNLLMPYKALVVGQMLAGIGTPLTEGRITSAAQARALYGAGSMLAQACAKYLEGNSTTELWAIAVADDPTGVKSNGSVAVTGAATESGTLYLYVGGRKIRVGVISGAQAAAVATNLAAAINAEADCPVTAAANAGTVTLTAKHAGEAHNGVDLRLNYYGESTPAGLSLTLTAMSGGTGSPEVDELIAALGDEQYHVIAWPWTDASSLAEIKALLEERWGPLKQIEGVAVASAIGTHSQLGTLGDSHNSKHLCIMHAHGSPSPTWEVAAATAAAAAFYGNLDPARPFQTLPLVGILAPAKADRFTTFPEDNLLLFDGISTFSVDADGTVRIQRLITTYKTTPNGADDVAYLDLNTPLTLGYLRWSWRNRIRTKYPRHKLADDGGNYGPEQAIMTPKLGKAESIAWAREMETLGLMENIDTFAASVVCARSTINRNRLEWLSPPDLVNQFVVGATQMQFIL